MEILMETLMETLMEAGHAILIWLKPFSPYAAVCIFVAFVSARYGRKLNDMDGPMRFDRVKLEHVSVRQRKFPQDWLKDMLRGLVFLLIVVPIIICGGTLIGAVLFIDAVFR